MSYTTQLQDIANRYMKSGGGRPATAREIAAWAIHEGLWQPQPADLVDQCADQLSRAMREDYITDAQGRTVRAKHAARLKNNGHQMAFWADIRTADRSYMEIAFKQRRRQIVGDCHQLKMDVDSYNENRCKDTPIQMVFDFTRDLEELATVA